MVKAVADWGSCHRRNRMRGWCIHDVADASTRFWRGIVGFGLISAILAGPAAGQCQYSVEVIQAQPCPFTGPPATHALGLSSNGIVVGRYEFCATAGNEAFIWTPNPDGEGGIFTTLPRPDGVTSASAAGVNSAGFVIGSHTFAAGGTRGFIYDPDTQEFKYLEALDPNVTHGTISTLNAINESNVAVGSRRISAPGVQPVISNAVIWHPFGIDGEGPEVVVDLGDFGVGPNSSALALNNTGTSVVGWTGTGGDVAIPFHRDEKGNVSLLDASFGLDIGFAFAVSKNDVVVGSAVFYGQSAKAFIWHGDQLAVVEPLRGFTSGGALGVNNMGQVLVACSNGPNHSPAIYQHGETTLLSDLLVNGKAVILQNPRTISDEGLIVVRGRLGTRTVGVVLAPLERPVTDLNADCVTDVHDLLMLLEQWGRCDGCSADFTGSGTVGVPDLLYLLSNWG